MTDVLSRAFAGDLQVRADAEGRTVTGIVVPFDVEARVSDGGKPYTEMFARGAFRRTIQHKGDRVKLLMQHNSREPVGRATLLREDPEGLYGEFRISNVPSGDHAIELVRDGVIDSFSVGFAPVRHEKRGAVVVRTEVALREASLVTFPAYEDARVGGIRAAMLSMTDEERDELRAMLGLAHELPTTTADGRSESDAPPVEDPASATPDVSPIRKQYQHLRLRAREIGAL